MKVSLRQAHKIVEKISGRLATIRLSAQQTVNIWDETDPEVLLDKLGEQCRQEQKRQLNLLGARQDIRTSIQAVNGTEVNGLVATRKALLDQLATYRHLQGTIPANAISTGTALKAKLAAERAGAGGGRSSVYSNDTITVSVFTEADVENLDNQINELQLRVEAIEDQLSAANANGSVTIGDFTLAILRKEGIVQ